MKRIIVAALFICALTGQSWGEDAYYKIEDPAIAENFRRIYLLLDQHKHDGVDSVKLSDVIPSSPTMYSLGNSTTPWAAVYGDQTVLGNRTSAQLKTMVAVSSGTLIYNFTDKDVYVATATSAGAWRNIRTGGGP